MNKQETVYRVVPITERLPENSSTVPVIINKETYNSNDGARSWGDKAHVSYPPTPMSGYYAEGKWYWEYGDVMNLSEGEELTHWLEKQTGYFFTEEEMKARDEKIISDAVNDWQDECERLAGISKFWQEQYHKVAPPDFQLPKIDNF